MKIAYCKKERWGGSVSTGEASELPAAELIGAHPIIRNDMAVRVTLSLAPG